MVNRFSPPINSAIEFGFAMAKHKYHDSKPLYSIAHPRKGGRSKCYMRRLKNRRLAREIEVSSISELQ